MVVARCGRALSFGSKHEKEVPCALLKCWRGGRDDLALPSRRARARVSAAGDASLRPWPREPLASTGCLRAGGANEALARRSAIHPKNNTPATLSARLARA